MEAPTFFSSVVDSRVNRERGVIEGVSVVTAGIEAKGHGQFTDLRTLETFKACAETYTDGVRVKVDHGTGFNSIVGTLKAFRIEGGKLLADLHLLKAHEKREQILEVAETMPASVGISVSFSGALEKIDGKNYARCVELYSADLVDRPAANPSGLFQRVDSSTKGMDSKSLLKRFQEFFSTVESEVNQPVNFEARASELETQLSAKTREFSELQTRVTELTAAKERAETELTAANEKLSTFEARVDAAAAQKAQAINAQLGVPPTNTTSAANSGKTDFASLVAAQIAAGKSKGSAIQFCVQSNPKEYAEWRANPTKL